jgi:tetratricopeptide (TPR) repeat protein
MLNSKNLAAQEMKAVALDRLGAKDKSLEEYESLYLKSNDINFLYKVAFFQYELKRFRECITNIKIMLEGTDIDNEMLVFSGENNEQQEIPMRASLINLRGMVEQGMGNKEEARKYYNQALEISPEFFVCRENLNKLDD